MRNVPCKWLAFLGEQCELDREEVALIAEIFMVNGWSACKTAILRELTEGTTVEELYLASQVKRTSYGKSIMNSTAAR